MNTAVIEHEQRPAAAAVAQAIAPKVSILAKFAARYSVDPNVMLDTLKNTAFRQREGQPPVTNEQMVALLIVADQYKLNPFTKEIYAFPDKGGIVPVVGVDGWSRIINEHAQFDGMDFGYGPDDKAGVPEWIECVMHRKDRARPTVVREFMRECRRGTQPWQSHPTRMLRHKAMIQCARLAFGFGGIYDEDEAERIVERDMGKASIAPAPNIKPRALPTTDQPPTPPAAPAAPESQPSTFSPAPVPPSGSDGGADPSHAAASADSQEPPGPAAPAPLLPQSQRTILEKKMKAGEITRADVEKRFGKPFDLLTVNDFQAVRAFIDDPVGG